MKASGIAFSSAALLGLMLGPQQTAHAAWSSYLHSLSAPPVATAPPASPSAQKSEEETPSSAMDTTKQQGDYLSYLSSPRPLMRSQGLGIGHQTQPQQPTQPAVVQEIFKSTTGTDYLSRLSTGSIASSHVSPPKVVYAPVTAPAGPGAQVHELSSLGATDYLSQLSVAPRNGPSTLHAAPRVEAAPMLVTAPVQIGSSMSFPSTTDYLSQLSVKPRDRPSTKHAAPRLETAPRLEAAPVQIGLSTSFPSKPPASPSDTQNGANFLSFLTSPSVSTTSKGDPYPGTSARQEVREKTGSHLEHLSSTPFAKPSEPNRSSTVSSLTAKSASARSESSSTSKGSYSPFRTKPQPDQGSSFSAVGTPYMNFLGTGPSRTSWYAEPLYVKPWRAPRVETRRKDEKPVDKIQEHSTLKAPTGTSAAALHEVRKQPSPDPSSYLSSLSRPTCPGAVTPGPESVPDASSPASSYSPFERQPQTGGGAGYLASLTTGPPVSVTRRGEPPKAAPAPSEAVSIPPLDYLSSLGGQPSSKSVPVEAAVTATAPSSPANYLAGLSTKKTTEYSVSGREDADAAPLIPSKASFSPFGESPKGVTERSYLTGLSGQRATSSSLVLRFSAESEVNKDRTTYAPFGRIPKAASQTGYLSGLAGGSPVTSSPAATRHSPENYSPFGKLPKAVTPPAGYLSSLASSDIHPSPAVGSSGSPRTSYSPFGVKPKAVASTGYLSGLGSTTTATKGAPTDPSRTNFSPFGAKPRALKETGYLSTLAHPTAPSSTRSASDAPAEPAVDTPKSYSPFGRKPTVASATGYLGSLSGGPHIQSSFWSRVEAERDAVLTRQDPKSLRGVVKPIARYHPVSGALVVIPSSR